MNIIDRIIGVKSLERQRDFGKEFAEEMYGGAARSMNSLRSLGLERATTGIGDVVKDTARTNLVNETTRPTNLSVFGGNQAAAIAGTSAQDMFAMEKIGELESGLAVADYEARMQGAELFAKTTAEQSRLEAMEKAAKKQVDMEFEAERSARRGQLFASAIGLGLAYSGQIGKGVSGLSGLFRGQSETDFMTAPLNTESTSFLDRQRKTNFLNNIFGNKYDL